MNTIILILLTAVLFLGAFWFFGSHPDFSIEFGKSKKRPMK